MHLVLQSGAESVNTKLTNAALNFHALLQAMRLKKEAVGTLGNLFSWPRKKMQLTSLAKFSEVWMKT